MRFDEIYPPGSKALKQARRAGLFGFLPLIVLIIWLFVVIASFAAEKPDSTFTLPPMRDLTSKQIFELRAVGRYEEALASMREITGNPSSFSRPRLAWAEDKVTSLEPIVGLPPAQRRRLAIADSLVLQIRIDWTVGRYVSGAELCQQILAVRRGVLGVDNPDVAQSYHDLGIFRLMLGEYKLAESHLRQALKIRQKIQLREQCVTAETLHFLGELLFETGRYDEAEEVLLEALEMRRAALGDDSEQVDRDLLEIAQVHMRRGDYSAAEPLVQRALGRSLARRGENYWLIATLRANLAIVAEERGDLIRAEGLCRSVVKIRRAFLHPDHPHVARSIMRLGAVLAKMDRSSEAEVCLRHALAMNEEFCGLESPEAIESRKSLADLLVSAGAFREAESFYRQTLDLKRRQFGARHADVADLLVALARLRYLKSDLGGAEEFLTTALAVYRESLGARHPAVGDACQLQAHIHLARHEYSAAESTLSLAASIFETARTRVGAGYARARFSESPYCALAAARLITGHGASAWEAVERSRGRALADLLWAPESEARESEPMPPTGGLLTETVANFHTVASLESVQAALGERTALIGVLDAPPGQIARGPWVYVIRPDRAVQWIELRDAPPANRSPESSSPIPSALEFRDELETVASWPFRVTAAQPAEAHSELLWNYWLGPLRPHLEGIRRLVVISAGALATIPVEALRAPNGRYVVENYTVSYVPSATIFASLVNADRTSADTAGEVLVVGAPSLVAADDDQRGNIASGGAPLSNLPWTRPEVLKIADLFPLATVLVGNDASEQALDQMAGAKQLRRFQTIHFATHAVVDDQRPGGSGLILSSVDLPDPLDLGSTGGRTFDGVLTAGEIARDWKLDADLVTLSSCQTARGMRTDGEGYVGLAHAFLRAGAKSLVVSLWSVEDEATAMLMGRFYRNLSASDRPSSAAAKATALQEAKLWLREFRTEAGERPFQHPAYWAAFILVGKP